jgi:hypothetical protein
LRSVSLRFTPEELVEKLVALVPPPRANTVLYHGVFAPRHAWRAEVLPKKRSSPQRRDKLVRRTAPSSRWVSWAELLHRVFGLDGWACPLCGQQMVLRAVVLGPPATFRVLEGLARAARGPPAGCAA